MGSELIISGTDSPVPAQIASAGEPAVRHFIEFFTANIRNRNTRLAYARNTADFFAWCQTQGLGQLRQLQPMHVAAYIEQIGLTHSAPSVKQHLAAIRMLF